MGALLLLLSLVVVAVVAVLSCVWRATLASIFFKLNLILISSLSPLDRLLNAFPIFCFFRNLLLIFCTLIPLHHPLISSSKERKLSLERLSIKNYLLFLFFNYIHAGKPAATSTTMFEMRSCCSCRCFHPSLPRAVALDMEKNSIKFHMLHRCVTSKFFCVFRSSCMCVCVCVCVCMCVYNRLMLGGWASGWLTHKNDCQLFFLCKCLL